MKTLLWREFHWNRLILVMGAAILVLPYLFVLIVGLWPRAGGSQLDRESFAAAAYASFVLSHLTIAFLGGNAFAGERADRSAQFLAYLPVSRKDRLLSKVGLTAIVVAVIVFVNLFVFRIAYGRFPWEVGKAEDLVGVMRNVVSTGFVMFGVGWLISSFGTSPTLAVCGGIGVPMAIAIGLHLVIETYQIREGVESVFAWYAVICGILGVLGFALGTWLFLKRVEP